MKAVSPALHLPVGLFILVITSIAESAVLLDRDVAWLRFATTQTIITGIRIVFAASMSTAQLQSAERNDNGIVLANSWSCTNWLPAVLEF